MPTSQNGYPANNIGLTSVRRIPGTQRSIRLRNGAAGDLLLWVLGEFDRLVEDLDGGVLDDWGYAERPIRGSTTVLSNHASGTAADANATRHPQGTNPAANFSASQIATIRAIVARTEGCVRWGGDYTAPALKDGMHFEIIASEARCAAVLAKLTGGGSSPANNNTTEDEMAGHFIDHEYPAASGRQFHHRAIQTAVDSAVVFGGTWFELSSGYQDITDVTVYFNHYQAPIRLDRIPKDQPMQWRVPEGCDSVSFDYVCAGPSSSLMIYGTKK